MNHNPKISVIVPIYKVEKYIERCLNSIKAQSFRDYEVIMIDDGTPDNSAKIAERYTADPRFKLFRQNNSGVGITRNKGIQLAQGEYLAFVDSDDAVFPDHLEKLYNAAVKADADIVCCSYCCCDENGGHIRKSRITKSEGVYCSDKLIGNILRDISVRRYLWSKLWRKSLFTDYGISFPCQTFEDACIIPMLFYNARTIAAITDRTYIYTCRNNSITGLTGKNCIGDYLKANERVEDYFLSTPQYEFYLNDLRYQRVKTVLVTFCWLFVRAFRNRSMDYFGGNLKKICRYASAPLTLNSNEKRAERKADNRLIAR
ncbi:MAG: glycosyltransferase [Firmicutes bacterium]|nr:glycosyltransferase [[Eubacterium] siraeum]MCM1486885.1 glycosyltransferase [Bacillota bacterium]